MLMGRLMPWAPKPIPGGPCVQDLGCCCNIIWVQRNGQFPCVNDFIKDFVFPGNWKLLEFFPWNWVLPFMQSGFSKENEHDLYTGGHCLLNDLYVLQHNVNFIINKETMWCASWLSLLLVIPCSSYRFLLVWIWLYHCLSQCAKLT